MMYVVVVAVEVGRDSATAFRLEAGSQEVPVASLLQPPSP